MLCCYVGDEVDDKKVGLCEDDDDDDPENRYFKNNQLQRYSCLGSDIQGER